MPDARTISIDGVAYAYTDDGPVTPNSAIDEFFQGVFTSLALIIDQLCELPPLSWFDMILRGFVGPRS